MLGLILTIEDEQLKTKSEAELNDFCEYLTINVLYDLIVNRKDYSYIHCSWDPYGVLEESIEDAKRTLKIFLPRKTRMLIYKDRVKLNGSSYYELTNSHLRNIYNKSLSKTKTQPNESKKISVLISNN